MTSVNATLYEREQEPEFFARKCRYCKKPVGKCECEPPQTQGFGSVHDPVTELQEDFGDPR